MDKDRAREVAAAAGLSWPGDKHLAEIANAMASTRELAGRLPKDLHWSEEMALVARLPTKARPVR